MSNKSIYDAGIGNTPCSLTLLILLVLFSDENVIGEDLSQGNIFGI